MSDIPFAKTKLMINSLYKNEAINRSENGRELAQDVGIQLAKNSIEMEKSMKAANITPKVLEPIEEEFERKLIQEGF